ncbi:MAG TPA: tetratricopeptide repeat protein [Anaeromyxobacteraceae bacterium]|nr:tetratricopeptide repeat protein [Anaeromyxobacteraceae bacterium]
MAADKNKIIAEATRLVQKGQYDKAIKAYEKILAEDAKEVRILLKVGELQQKKGDSAAAAATFNQVAEIYGEQGFFLKAVAVYKQIAKLEPEDVRVNERLASLYQQLGLMNDAMGQLQAVAAVCERTGDQVRLLDVLRRMVDLDPDNVVSCVKLGELNARAGKNAEALELFRRAAGQLRDNKRVEEYLKVAERIALLAPDDQKLTRELAHAYLSRGDTKRALAKLQLCFKADPRDVETLRLLAQAFRDLGQNSKTVSVYKELARVYAERGRQEEARVTWKLVLEIAPGDADAEEALGISAAPPPAPSPPPRPEARAPAAGPPPGAARPPAAAPPRPPTPAPPAPGPRPVGPDAVSRLITETDVYVKYGLHQKALEHVQKVLTADPESPDALERMRDIRETLGSREAAVEAAERAVRSLLERGPEDRARAAVLRLRELDPGHPALAEFSAAAGLDDAPPLAGEDDLALAHAAEEREELVADEVSGPTAKEAAPEASAPASEPLSGALDDEPLGPPLDDEPLMLGSENDVPPVTELLSVGPAPLAEDGVPEEAESQVPIELDPVEAEALALDDAEPLPIEPEPEAPPATVILVEPASTEPEPPAPVQAEAVPPPPPVAPPELSAALETPGEPDLSEELEEVAFLAGQGLVEEALEVARGLHDAYPSHSLLAERLRELEAEVARGRASDEVPPPAAVPADLSGALDAFDIGKELAAELGGGEVLPAGTDDFQYSVEDVFDQFKKGLEKAVRPEDSETHYDLGIAYKEMGLVDDALAEFRTALGGNNRRKEVDVLTMVGLCHGMKGEHREAVQAFRRALNSEFLTGEAAKALHYELGLAHEALSEPAVALWYFQKIVKVDPRYRDARAHVERLGGGPGQPPAGDAPPSDRVPPAPPPGAGQPPGPGPKKNIGFI